MSKKNAVAIGLGALLMVAAPLANAYIYKDPGVVENRARYVEKHKKINSSYQHRKQNTWMYVDDVAKGAATGFYQAGNWLKLHNRKFTIGVGSVEFDFNPSKLNCTQGFNFNLEVGEDTVSSFSPSCDDLLNASVEYPISHYFDLIPDYFKPKVEVPLDPVGLFKLGVKFGAGVEVGADFKAGGAVGAVPSDKPFQFANGVRNPDYIFAQVEPYVDGLVTSSAYGQFGHGVAEAGVKGKLSLLKVKGKGYLEAGIRRVEADDVAGKINEEGYVKMEVKGEISGGKGKIEAYCKKLFGLIVLKADLYKWDPIWKVSRTFFKHEDKVWQSL
ncbi:hypothetical protein CS022_08025 [Veronia nyctiphanis]|uniref:Uncharacterized protein n=1 Tax=Veronia nyctiphanis TaxID=1278244 RepID=A0A4V1LT21_9GAMM|nr:hypothetical protein [Veronia nyctiphanis]RXJ73678.1 hypothetical protein CS022_08025 [Veronia nyctiphanis]